MKNRRIIATIDVTKLNQEKFVVGKIGTYATLTLVVNEEEDEFGNNVLVFQSLSKDEIDPLEKPPIVGAGKTYHQQLENT